MSNFRVCEFFCNQCNWKLIADNTSKMSHLVEMKTGSIQGHLPKLNTETKKIEKYKPITQKKKFRCPNCGFGVTPRILDDVQKEINFKSEQIKKEEEYKKLQDFISDHTIRKKNEDRINGSEESPEGS